VFRIAHISDTHVLSPEGVQWRDMLFNKRMTGWANMHLRRGRAHRRDYLQRVLAAVPEADHLVVTGDITNLALENEYRETLRLFAEVAATIEVTFVPGNHDLYLPRVSREGRFERHFGSFVRSDLPDLAVSVAAGAYPFVKLRGPVAIIGLSSAVPRPPFVAAGYLGDPQLKALEATLQHPEVSRRIPVVLVHHPPVDSRTRLWQLRDGLTDAAALRSVLAPLDRGLVLFGHLHRRVRYAFRSLDVVAASGAALDHPDVSIRAGYNVYELDGHDVLSAAAHVVDPDGGSWRRTEIAIGDGGRQ
jgi:3',5'-cyclic AMP phosphodiesterase CpdA